MSKYAVVFRTFAGYVNPHRSLFLATSSIAVVAALAALPGPYFLRMLVDQGIVLQQPHRIVNLAALVALLAIIQWSVNILLQYLRETLVQRILVDLRTRVYAHALQMPASFHHVVPSGTILSRLINDVQQVGNWMATISQAVLMQALVGTGYIIMAMLINVQLTLLVLALIPPFIFLTHRSSRSLRDMNAGLQEQLADVSGQALEDLSGFKVLKLFHAIPYRQTRLVAQLQELAGLAVRMVTYTSVFSVGANALVTLGPLLVLCVGSYMAIMGNISLGQLFAFYSYSAGMYTPIAGLIGLPASVNMLSGAVERLNTFLDAPEEKWIGTLPLDAAHGDIVFENVTVLGRNALPILKNLSITIPMGKTVVLLGASGSGKSTIVNLISGLLQPKTGRVTIGGIDLSCYTRESLRRQIGTVPQDLFLFQATIAENITLGRQEISLNQVQWAAEVAQIAPEIDAMPGQYQTVVGQRGLQMSGGQAQRIALARAVAGKPSIFLLDEATGSVSLETEQGILASIRENLPGCTIVLVSHRPQSALLGDFSYELRDGQFVRVSGVMIEPADH